MNNERRKQLSKLMDKIEELKGDLEGILSDEDDARDSMPENLQESDRYYASEDASDNMNSAIDSLGDAIDSLDDAING